MLVTAALICQIFPTQHPNKVTFQLPRMPKVIGGIEEVRN